MEKYKTGQEMNSHSRLFLPAIIGAVLMIAVTVSVGFAQEFTLQVLSSSNNATAEKTKEALRKDGFDAYIARHEAGEAAVVYRVRIGRFGNRKNAEKIQEALRAKGVESWVAVAEGESSAQQTKPLPENDAPEKKISQPAGAAEIAEAPAPPAPETKLAEPAEKSAQPAAAGSKQEAAAGVPAADTKIFELVINPVPAFTNEQAAAPATAATPTVEQCRPDKQYSYFDPQNATLHITNDETTIPKPFQKQLRQITIFPACFKQMNLHDMSMQVEIEKKPFEIGLDGISQARQTPSRQAVLDFESLLRENPLRILYYPPRTDPDGTLHGALFFKSGLSVEQEMVRRGLAACEGAPLAP